MFILWQHLVKRLQTNVYISVAAGDNIKEDGSCLERLPPHALPDKLIKLDEKILSEKEKYPIAVAPSMLDIKSKMENLAFNSDEYFIGEPSYDYNISVSGSSYIKCQCSINCQDQRNEKYSSKNISGTSQTIRLKFC